MVCSDVGKYVNKRVECPPGVEGIFFEWIILIFILFNIAVMEKIRFWIRKTFGFSQRESNGFLVLSSLILITLFVPSIFDHFYHSGQAVFSKDEIILDSLMQGWVSKDKKENKVSKATSAICTAFDPNVSEPDHLEKILGKKVSSNIIRYRMKGGKFKTASDLRKIFGMSDSLFHRIQNCIVFQSLVSDKKNENRITLDINKADSIALQQLKGIGKVRASRIIRFREKLGGFVSVEQFNEIYGIDSIALNELLSRTFISPFFQPLQVNINTADIVQLQAHPYIGRMHAKNILRERKKKIFLSKEDLKERNIFSEEEFNKLLPYLKWDDQSFQDK
jgi:competence ComEA-like helix-hairpin-helix protein